jgi:alkylhydroperoxidase/carboxymuconolactone decarboxylase family protein YurZ
VALAHSPGLDIVIGHSRALFSRLKLPISYCLFGDVWERSKLSKHDRSLIMVAASIIWLGA